MKTNLNYACLQKLYSISRLGGIDMSAQIHASKISHNQCVVVRDHQLRRIYQLPTLTVAGWPLWERYVHLES